MVELSQTDAGTYRRGFAGDTFNAAWYARRALPPEWEVAFGSCIGTDEVSGQMADFMAGEGIDTSSLRRVPDRGVGLYMISLADGERSFTYWRDSAAARTLADDTAWLDATLDRADHVHVSGITLAILSPEARGRLVAALSRARAAGTGISLDTNIRTRLWESETAMRETLMRAATVSDIVLPGFDEEAVAFGDRTPSETVARYRSAGAALVVVKNGPGAILLGDASGETAIDVARVDPVVDTTAAGDSFAGAFLAARLQGAGAQEAVIAAARVAGRVIGARGALVATA